MPSAVPADVSPAVPPVVSPTVPRTGPAPAAPSQEQDQELGLAETVRRTVDAAVQDAYLTHGPWSHVLEGSLLARLERAGYSCRTPETLRTVLGAGVTFGRLTGNGFLGYRPTVPYAWTLLRAADRPLMDVLTGWYRRPGAFAFGGRQDLRTHTRALCEHVVTAYPHDAYLVLPFAVHTASFMSAAGLRQAVDLLTDRGAPPLPAVRALLQLAPTDPYAPGSDPVAIAAAVAAALTSR